MSDIRESKVQKKCLDLARKYGGYAYKNAQNMYTEVGRPDIVICVPTTVRKLIELFGEDGEVGIFAGIELKRPGKLNNVSDAQYIVGKKIQQANGVWLAVDDPAVVEGLMLRYKDVDECIYLNYDADGDFCKIGQGEGVGNHCVRKYGKSCKFEEK